MKFKEFIKQRWAAYTIATCSAVILFMILSHLSEIFKGIDSLWTMISPVIIGILFSYLLNPAVNFFSRTIFKKVKKTESRHTCSVLLSIGVVILVITVLCVMIVPALTSSITGIVTNYDSYYRNLMRLVENLNQVVEKTGLHIELSQISDYLTQFLATLFDTLKKNLNSILGKIGNIGSSIFNIIIGFIIAIYFMMARENIKKAFIRLWKVLVPEERLKAQSQFLNRCNSIFVQYLVCSILDAFIIGISNAVFMGVFQMKNITLISLIVGVTNLLPTFGPIIGGVLGVVLLLLTTPEKAIVFVIFTIILQTADGYVIKPRLFSDSLGMSPVLSLVSIILGGKMFGVTGIFLAIPVVAVLDMLYGEEFLPWLQQRKEQREQKQLSAPPEEEPED